jgi:hypothetical protein
LQHLPPKEWLGLGDGVALVLGALGDLIDGNDGELIGSDYKQDIVSLD